MLVKAVSDAAFTFGVFWIVYLALEPWVRRYWPQTMITWSRLLAGRWQDPMVGRDVLFGVLCGVLYGLLIQGAAVFSRSINSPPFSEFGVANLIGLRMAAGNMARLLASALTGGLQLFLLLFLLKTLLRKQWIAAIGFVALLVLNQLLPNLNATAPLSMLLTRGLLYTAIYGILVAIMLRLGFFAFMVTLFSVNSLVSLYLSPDFGSWQGESSLLVVAVLGTLALWGFKTSLAGQPVFGRPVLEK